MAFQVWVIFAKIVATDDALFFKHDGDEEFIYIISGELDFHYNSEVFRMRTGDSIYYDSSQPHGWVSVGAETARAVAVMYTKE